LVDREFPAGEKEGPVRIEVQSLIHEILHPAPLGVWNRVRGESA
jgi:hypothetical protein